MDVRSATRREALKGSLAVVAYSSLPIEARALFPNTDNSSGVPTGWNVLPLGCGGLVKGASIAEDGSIIMRTDVGNGYVWSGTVDIASVTNPANKWNPLFTFANLAGVSSFPNCVGSRGVTEAQFAPGDSNRIYAIYNDLNRANLWWIYVSTDKAASWAQSNLSFANADSNSANGNAWASGIPKIIVDPVNPDVCYVGMPMSSGKTSGVYTTFNAAGGSDKLFFYPASIDGGATLFPLPTLQWGASSMYFDKNYGGTGSGTTVVGGQTVTKRIIIPVAGSGVYESLDGGQTFTEVAQSTMGYGANFNFFFSGMNYNGVFYLIAWSSTASVGFWRYSGPGGTWTNLTALAGWTIGNIVYFSIPVIDPRAGHNGYVSLTGYAGGGFNTGVTSFNADSATPSWRHTGQTGVKAAASYDAAWLSDTIGQGPGYANANFGIIDPNGMVWWGGDQGFWYIASPPDWGTAGSITSNSMVRGSEVTIAEDVCAPPGRTYPVMAAQDVGVLQGTFTDYPADYFVARNRMDCQCLEYSASDPSFITGKLNTETNNMPLSGYSINYGQTGTWTQYTTQPDTLYLCTVVGGISNGSGGPGSMLDVTFVMNGTVQIGRPVYVSGRWKGTVTGFIGGGTNGGAGQYSLSTSTNYVAPGSRIVLDLPTQSGQIVAVDLSHHVCVSMGLNSISVPCYTTNQGSSWAFCNGLPAINWFNRTYSNGPTAKPMAVGYGLDLGKVWAAGVIGAANVATIYRSTDSGANWVATRNPISVGAASTSPFLCTVPGYPQELWLAIRWTGGAPPRVHLYHSKDGGDNWDSISIPKPLTFAFCLGAALTPGGYPALYFIGYQGPDYVKYLYQGDYIGGTTVNWSLYGPTGSQADLPPLQQVAGWQSIHGDWEVPGLVYAPTAGCGFAYYIPA